MTRLTRRSGRRWLRWLIATTVVIVIADLLADRALGIRYGLNAVYFDGADWQIANARPSVIEDRPSTGLLEQQRPGFGGRPFSVEWRGFLAVPLAGTYSLVTVSDGASSVYVRGQELVGTIALDAGIHPILIRYSHASGDCLFELRSGREGRALALVPSFQLLAERVSYAGWLTRYLLRVGIAVVTIAWFVCIVASGARLILCLARPLISLPSGGVDAALIGILLLSLALNVWGIWWSMPNVRGWAPDELVPQDVRWALENAFSHGWRDKYPPLHYAVLAAAETPMLALSRLGVIDLDASWPNAALVLIGRVVTLAMATGTLVVVYRIGVELYGRRGALCAALALAVMVPFAYYAKLANVDVPYLFWFALSLLAYLRIVEHHRRRDYILFAASATLAVCTKDQAYGLYVFTLLAIVYARWRRWKRDGGPARTLLIDGTTVRALGVAIVIFLAADNLLFNFSGFVDHVKLIVGPVSSDYQVFAGSVTGQLQMAWSAIQEFRYMFGWPLAILVAVGVGVGLVRGPASLRWLTVPALSYYVTFLAVVLYFYDRFLLPIGLILALFTGYGLEKFLAPAMSARRLRLGLVAAIFGYSVIYVAAVDYSMSRDARYSVTEWMHANVKAGQVVGSLGALEYVAQADGFAWQSVASLKEVADIRPSFIVLNADQIARLPIDHPARAMHDALRQGQSGYRLALRTVSPALPLPGRHPDLGESRRQAPQFSMLSMVNPTMEIFRHEAR